MIHCSYQILPGRHGKYSQLVSKVLFLSGRSSLVNYVPGVLTSQSERFFFFITFVMQQKLMREHIQLLEVRSFVIVWASQVVLVVKNQPVNAGDVRSSGGRKWQPSPVFLPGESYGQRGLVGLQSMGSQRLGHN